MTIAPAPPMRPPSAGLSRRAALLAGAAALAACAAPAPPAFGSWDGAMRRAAEATDAFLAAYAPYEARVAAMAGDAAPGPALSAEIAAGVAAVAAYGDALALYASGAAFAEVREALAALETEAALLAALVGGPAGFAGARASAGLLSVALDQAARAVDGARFAAAVEAEGGRSAAFLRSVRLDAAPLMRRVAEAAIADRARAARAGGSAVADGAAERAAFAAALDAWTGALAAAEAALVELEAATAGRAPFMTPAEAAGLGAEIRRRAAAASVAVRALEALF